MTALLKPLLRRIDFGTPLKDTASLSLDFVLQQYYAQGLGDEFSEIITFTRSTTAQVTNSSGTLVTAAINEPRFNYDPVTLQPRGLLIEEARTNLLTYSEDFGDASWGSSLITVANNSVISPRGTLTAARITTTAANANSPSKSVSGVTSAGSTYTYSIWIRADIPQTKVLQIPNETFASYLAQLSINVTTVWQRFSITFTGKAGALWIRSSSTAGEVFDVFGAQLEAGAFPTSYIPTVASQVTRAADVASVNTLSPWYNATEGTVVASFTEGLGFYPPVFTLDDGTGNNRFYIYRNAASATQSTRLAADGSAAGVSIFNSLSPTETGDGTLAFAYANNSFALVFKGGAVATDNSGAVPTNTTLSIGNNTPTGRKLNGHIRTIRYFPRKLANSELQAITV